MLKKLLSLSLLALATLSAKATYVPVALTGFNTDAVCNGAGAPNTSTTNLGSTAASPSGFDAQGYWLMDSTFNPGSGTTTAPALPGNLLINSAATSGLTWQLKPYSGNNALRIVNVGADSLVFQTPQTAGELYILYNNIAPSSASGSVDITVNFTDGTTQLLSANPTPNWFNNIAVSGITSTAYLIGGRYNGNSSGFENNTTGPQLYQFKVSIAVANQTKTVRSVRFANTITGHILNVFGITLNTPCSGTPIAGTTVSNSGSSACTGVNFTLSLTGSNAGIGTTYQWQTSATGTTGSWTSVSGATNATYTTSQTVATYYRAYNTCGGTGPADTSVPLNLGMTPVSQCYCIPVASSNTYYIPNFSTTGGTVNISTTSGTSVTSPGYSNYFPVQNVTAMQGTTVNFNVGLSTTGGFGIGIWVDWNQNGTFESSEKVYGTTSYSFSASNPGSFVVPITANPGVTRMRVMCDYNSSTVGSGPCAISSASSGEAEDYSFTVTALPPCTAPTTQPTALVLTPGTLNINGSFTAASPAVDRYLVVRTQGAALNTVPTNGFTYTAGAALGNGIVVSYAAATTFADAGLTTNTNYTYTIFACNNTVGTCGPTYNTTTPLTGSASTLAAAVYTWNATTGSADWTVAASWTPARTTPDQTDILQFTNGGSSTATNIPTQTVRRIGFGNNTATNFQAAAAATLTLASDNDPVTYELNIAQGSSLVSNGTTAALTLAFSGTGGTSKIAGTLEVSNTGTPVNAVNFTNTTDTVTATGTLAGGGTLATAPFTSTTANLVVMGTYNYKYSTVAGTIPTATWGTGSTALISGVTTATANPSGLGQTFYNFNYACPLQTVATTWSTIPTTINGTLTVDTTGTNEWQWSSTSTVTLNNFAQTRGVFNMGTTATAKTINIGGTFNQTKGILKVSGTGAVTLNWNGTAAQTANFVDSAASGPVIYQVSNSAGLTLTGSGILTTTPAFKINNGGGVRITTTNVNPVNTTLALTYATTGSTLTYDASATATPTAIVWPATNGPANLTTNLSGTAPANRLIMPFSRSLAGTLTITNGVIILNNNDLSITNNASGAISVTGSATKMVAINGTGQLKRAVGTTASTSYLFPVGDTLGTIEYSPVTINFVSNAAPRNIGVRVVDAQHPNDLSTVDYLSRYWAFTDDGGAAAYTYNGSFTYTTADIVGTESNIRLNLWKSSAWNQIPSSPSSGTLTITGPVQYSVALPLGGNQVTGRQYAATTNIYTWNGVTSTDWQDPTNWTPNRNTPDITDILQFNNGIIDTTKNIPTQTVARLLFTNNTTGVFQTGSASTLTFASDNNATTNELDIAAGSSLINNSTAAALTLAFSGTGGTSKVAGNLEIANASVANVINFTNTTDTVTATGTLAAGGATAGTITSTAANLVINGTFNYKYTTVTGAVPTATWGTGSTVLISGITTATAGPSGGLGQTFSNFKYACPLQTVANIWSTTPTTINGTFTVDTTGTNEWQWSATSNTTVNNYAQTKGIFNVNTSSTAKAFNVSGSLNQTKGVLKVSGTGAVTFNFNGTSGTQNANFVDSSVSGPAIYQVSNGGGINLTGSGALTTTPVFKINSGGGVRITTTSTNPVNTTLALTYAATGTTLSFDTTGSMSATAAIWPATNSPLNVTINSGNSSNVVNTPVSFNRTVGGTLTMTSGDINIGANTLTLGTAAATPGTLTYTAGNIRLTTGSFVRWYGAASLPTAAGTGVGFYPVAFGGANRNVALYFSVATITTGGSIGVSHTNAGGLFTLSPSVADGAYNIDKRTNAFWSFSQSGIALGTTTIGMKLTGTGLFNATNPANLRVMQANAVVGTHVAGAGVSAVRTGLTTTDLAANYYIGAAAIDIGGVYVAINSGAWGTGSTWDIGTPPGIGNDAYINSGVTVTADALNDSAKSLTIYPGGTLTINTNSVTIDSTLNNNGIVNVGGGTLTVRGNTGANGITNNAGAVFNVTSGTATLGPVGGSNKPFTHNAGAALNVSGGTLNINGNLNVVAAATVTQTGGNINVDGNAGGVAANSVACGTPIVSLKSASLTFTGGTFTIVDAHTCTTGNNTFEYNNGTTISAGGTHTFVFGNGLSTDPGGQTPYNFSLNTNVGSGKFAFNNIIANAGTAANSAVTMGASNTGVLGNVTVNSGGELRVNTSNVLYVNGNFTVNTGGTYTASTSTSSPTGTLYFGNYATGSAAPATSGAQVVSGGGTFRNMVSSPTANFAKITVSNSAGVTFNMTNPSFSNALTFVAGASGPTKLITTPGNAIIEIGGASVSGFSQTNGWVYGRYQKTAGSTGGFNGNLPVGDANYYTLVNFAAGTVVTTGGVWASTTSLDHPNINTSTINPTKSVNRYYTIGLANGLTFTAGTVNINFNWNAADVDAGATTANFKVGTYASAAWTYPTTASAAATSIQGQGITLGATTDFQVGEQCAAINITTQPANTVACAGSPVSLSVGLTSASGVLFQWQKGSTPISGATNATYTINSPTAADAGTYSVVMTSACAPVSGVTSATATLTVNQPVNITTQPAATQTICEGSPVSFSVVATGTGITYQWNKGGTPISGATNSTYTINTVAPGDAGNYTVTINGTAPCGNPTSSTAVLNVNPLPLTITAAGSTTFCAGGSVTLNASTTSGLTYQWNLGGSPMSGATNASYTAIAGGNYTATITNTANSCSNTSNTIAITNATPVSTITPASTAAFCQGGTVTLTGPSTAGITYQWNLAGSPISGATNQTYAAGVAGNYTLSVSTSPTCTGVSAVTAVSANPLPTATATAAGPTTFCQGGTVLINGPVGTGVSYQWRNSGSAISGATNNSYTANASGNYKIVVTNTTTGCIDSSTAVAVTVNPLPTATITAATATSFCIGGSVVLNANTGTGLTYQWSVGGNPISGATTTSYTASTSGSYTVTVTNTSTTCVKTSTATTVTVNPLPNATATAGGATTFCQGGNVIISVPTATGQTYQWKQGGTNIGGATNASYTVTASGSYTVVVTNTSTTCNATSTAIVVTVNPLPAATITPATAQTICQGDSVTYNANTGTGLTYQWKLGGNTITGATNTTFVAYAPGAYTVTVTNTATGCFATSAAANLTVNPRPTATISYTTPITFCDGGAVVLSGNSGTGYTYQWQQNGTPITGATGIDNIVSQSGIYSVVVTNSFGCSSAVSQPVTVTVNPLPVPVITRNNSVLSTGSFATYQWFLNNAPLAGGTGQSIVITQNGGYAVQVTDANGCTSRSPIMFVNNVGIVTPGVTGSDVKIYPNPAHQVVYIDAPVKVNIAIRDLTGKLIFVQDNAKEIDLGNFADGVYMIMVSDQNGRLIKTEKLFKSE